VTKFVSSSALLLTVLTFCACTSEKDLPDPQFERATVFHDDVNSDPWTKFTGDLNTDGIPELYIGYRGNGDIVQIGQDGSIARPVINRFPVQTDGAITDIDSDGIPGKFFPKPQASAPIPSPLWTTLAGRGMPRSPVER